MERYNMDYVMAQRIQDYWDYLQQLLQRPHHHITNEVVELKIHLHSHIFKDI